MIKALISDYDGTLTDHTHQLSQVVVEAVRAFQSQSFIFSIATGRMYQGINDYPLLINCGYKIAMGNAPDSLKAIADLVVGTQAEDGLVEVVDTVAQLQQAWLLVSFMTQ